MAERILTLLEVTGIQSYIFGSNQLAQNIGASELVARATTKEVVDTVKAMGNQTNAYWENGQKNKEAFDKCGPGIQYDGRNLQDGLNTEIVYAGGGNAMLLFHHMDDAINFVKALTLKLLKEAPGLKLIAAHKAYDHDSEVLADAHHVLRGKLAHRKRDHIISAPLLGQSVTAECTYTGLPAIGYDDEAATVGQNAFEKVQEFPGVYQHRPISAEVAAKIKAEREGKKRLDQVLPQVKNEMGFDFIYDFSELGDPDESSYIAVVHADGNQMGKRFEAIRSKHSTANQNDDYIAALTEFSLAVRRRAKRALSKTVDYLYAGSDTGEKDGRFGGIVRTPTNRQGKPVLPFRPIVFGGDDITFVCDGRLGLDLAAYYLNQFCEEGHTGEALEGGRVYARAGVAVVKTHYPFSRAYDLAEALAAQAKKAIQVLDPQEKPEDSRATVMDWHFATTGMMYEIKEIRKREYRSNNGRSMLMRPVTLEENATIWRTWQNFSEIADNFQNDKKWKGMRNKVLALRDALRQGETAVQLFIATHDQVNALPSIDGLKEMEKLGWQDNQCGYFDAIEAIDFFVSLDRKKEPAQ